MPRLEEIVCPITREPMKLPVVTNDGYAYEFAAIAEYLLQQNKRNVESPTRDSPRNPDPLTRQPIRSLTLIRTLDPELSELEKLNVAIYCYQILEKKLSITIDTILNFSQISNLVVKHQRSSLLNQAVVDNASTQVDTLLELSWVDVNKTDCKGNAAIHLACITNSLMTHKLLNARLLQLNLKNKDDQSALYLSCFFNNTKQALQLLAHPDVDPNSMTKSGDFPLFVAMERENWIMVHALMSHPKIKPNLRNNKGETVLYRASELGYIDFVQYFLSYKKVLANFSDDRGVTPFHAAVLKGHVDLVNFYLSLNDRIAVDQHDLSKNTPLHSSIRVGHLGIVRLLANNPNVSKTKRNQYGHTAVQLANKLHRFECATILSKKGLPLKDMSVFKPQPLRLPESKTDKLGPPRRVRI